MKLIQIIMTVALLFSAPAHSDPDVSGNYIVVLQGTCKLESIGYIRFDAEQYGNFDSDLPYWFLRLVPGALHTFNFVREDGCV